MIGNDYKQNILFLVPSSSEKGNFGIKGYRNTFILLSNASEFIKYI